MRNQKLLPHFNQLDKSEKTSFTTSTLRNLKKRTSRKIWILSIFVISITIFIWFPSNITLLTWRSEYDSSIDRSFAVIDVKDISRPVWRNKLDSTTPYLADKSTNLIDQAPQGAELEKTPTIHERIVVKEVSYKYKPLPKIPLDPNIKYEDVKGKNQLTKELKKTKFLTFLPHSGFHNQRIEIKNAFKLSKLLNRTLILPPIRLGRPIAWQKSQELINLLEKDELKYKYFSNCFDKSFKIIKLDKFNPIEKEECDYYSSWTSVGVGYILNIEQLTKEVPIIDRVDLRESWLWDKLKLSTGEWIEVKDDFRYSYQIFESSSIDQLSTTTINSKYNWRLNIDDLIKYNEVKLLSFGSLFGSDRIILNSKEMKEWNFKIEENQTFNLSLLEKISDKVAELLGGRGQYLGLHLRVGNAFFKTQAPQVIRETFITICRDILKLNQETIDDLIRQHDAMMMIDNKALENEKRELEPDIKMSNQGIDQLEDYTEDTSQFKSRNLGYETNRWDRMKSKKDHQNLAMINSKLKCKANIKYNNNNKYKKKTKKEKLMNKFKLVIYISTDLKFEFLEKLNNFNLFKFNFPCLFSFNNFFNFDFNNNFEHNNNIQQEKNKFIKSFKYMKTLNLKDSNYLERNNEIRRDDLIDINDDNEIKNKEEEEDEELNKFHKMKSNLDGLNLDKFLIPILESMIVSKGSHIIGTPSSTFSNYLINFLHPFYSSVDQKKKKNNNNKKIKLFILN